MDYERAKDDDRSDPPAPPREGRGRLLDWLGQPAHYPELPGEVHLVETHISWVFLTDRHAYKLKKPVRFDFLDFSTPERRRQACEEEVRLNRRLAGNVYLGVVALVRDRHGALHLGGEGEPLDWLVKMRRLPADRSLDQMILGGSLQPADVERVAAMLARFYQQASPVMLRAEDYLAAIVRHAEANRQELLAPAHGLADEAVRRSYAAQLRYLRLRRGVLEDRVCDGRIVDGHGDLRPEHIYLAPEPLAIDCIEFNREFRLIDVADELAFLAMECEALGAAWVGDALLAAYRRASGDAPADDLIAFYKCYRACVRAKVAAIRCEQLTAEALRSSREQAERYLRLAGRYAAQLGPPLLLVFRGLMGSGKSTLAAAVAAALGAEHLSTDEVRRELLGASAAPAEFGGGHYAPETRQAVYAELHRRAAAHLAAGVPVALDGTYLETTTLTQALGLAAPSRALPLVISCNCPRETALERIALRQAAGGSASEARPDLYEQQRAAAQALPEGAHALDVDTTAALPAQVERVIDALGGLA